MDRDVAISLVDELDGIKEVFTAIKGVLDDILEVLTPAPDPSDEDNPGT